MVSLPNFVFVLSSVIVLTGQAEYAHFNLHDMANLIILRSLGVYMVKIEDACA